VGSGGQMASMTQGLRPSVVANRFSQQVQPAVAADTQVNTQPALTAVDAAGLAKSDPVALSATEPVAATAAPPESTVAAAGAGQVEVILPTRSIFSDPRQNSMWHEGERIRALYGEGGLSAWQSDQYLKSLGLTPYTFK
jgi:hypothetical protein